jgi:hypothetical protein
MKADAARPGGKSSAVRLLCVACRSRRRSGGCPRDGAALDVAVMA